MRIAICDDEKIFAISLQKMLEKLGYISSSIDCYDSGEDLILSMKKSISTYDLIFLDIEMKRTNGIETAEEIREHNESVFIVFVTNYESYWQEGYKVNALQYFIKPVEIEKLEELLGKVERKLSQKNDNSLFIHSKGMEARISLEEIKYFEIYQERVTAFTITNETYEFYSRMNVLERELESKGFFRVHKSILMNLDYFYKRKEYNLFLTDQTILPISRNRIKAFKEALMKHHGGDIVF